MVAENVRTPKAHTAPTLYVSVGGTLSRAELRDGGRSLTLHTVLRAPAEIQYVCQHPREDVAYIASGDRANPQGSHHVTLLRLNAGNGSAATAGPMVSLPARPIHISIDRSAARLLVAHGGVGIPSGVSIVSLRADGTPEATIGQFRSADVGAFAHQIMPMPSGKAAIVCCRGYDAEGDAPEVPGSMRVFGLPDGKLEQTIAPNGGFGFGPRHVDFHPGKPLLYASAERQNQIQVFGLDGDVVSETPLFVETTLSDPHDIKPLQMAGAIHVHPDGRHLYVSNRAHATVKAGDTSVFLGGENDIAVFALDPQGGRPRLVQKAETDSFHPRTFSIDPVSGLLVAASVMPMKVLAGNAIRHVGARLTVFRIEPNGLLARVATHDIDTSGGEMFWSGFLN